MWMHDAVRLSTPTPAMSWLWPTNSHQIKDLRFNSWNQFNEATLAAVVPVLRCAWRYPGFASQKNNMIKLYLYKPIDCKSMVDELFQTALTKRRKQEAKYIPSFPTQECKPVQRAESPMRDFVSTWLVNISETTNEIFLTILTYIQSGTALSLK